MKKVLAIAVLLVAFTLVLAAMASAQAQPKWRIYIQADDNSNSNYFNGTTAGVFSSATDGYGLDGPASDSGGDGDSVYNFSSTTTPKSVAFVFGDKLWKNDIKSTRSPLDPAYAGANKKVWDMRVFGYPDSNTDTPIRIKFNVVQSFLQPPLTVSGSKPAGYYLKMVNNRGVEGAPNNGTVWTVPVPTTPQIANAMFFSVTLPTVKISQKDNTSALNQGYVMEFYQTPEPSSLLALGAGLMGLAGFASRRRRS